MIENCVLCGKKITYLGHRIICEDCNRRILELYRYLPSDLRDALISIDLTNAAEAICEEYGIKDFWYAIAGYITLITVEVKSKADLRGFLIKEAKLEPDDAKALANKIMSLYFE